MARYRQESDHSSEADIGLNAVIHIVSRTLAVAASGKIPSGAMDGLAMSARLASAMMALLRYDPMAPPRAVFLAAASSEVGSGLFDWSCIC